MSEINKKTVRPSIKLDIFNKIDELKQFYKLKDINEILEKLVVEHLKFNQDINDHINNICNKNLTRGELLIPVIDKYINKNLKSYGLVKEKHKKSIKAEDELLIALKDMVSFYDKQNLENRRYFTPTMVQKFLIVNYQKYKQKHLNVIRRVLMSDKVNFVKKYHEKNNLTVNSNKKGVSNE